ncbi:hypothetical protein KY285_035213 [Solanum tuberosum]|nr:hypothetical protein KY285_035213 [Solanum tuberosum]
MLVLQVSVYFNVFPKTINSYFIRISKSRHRAYPLPWELGGREIESPLPPPLVENGITHHSTRQTEALQVELVCLHLVRPRVIISLVTKNKQHLPKPIHHVASEIAVFNELIEVLTRNEADRSIEMIEDINDIVFQRRIITSTPLKLVMK